MCHPEFRDLVRQGLDPIPAHRESEYIAALSFDHHYNIIDLNNEAIKPWGNVLIIRAFVR